MINCNEYEKDKKKIDHIIDKPRRRHGHKYTKYSILR